MTLTTPPPSASTRDQHGNPIAAGAVDAARYDRAIDALLRYHPVVVEHATELVTNHADVAMGHALLAYLHLMSTDAPDVAVARKAWTTMGDLPMGEREQAHHAAIGRWIAGDWHGAADTLDNVLQKWPTDLLALQIGHQLDFFVGDAINLRDRPGRSLPALDPDHPHTAFVRGMQAFGLEEAGHYGAAEAAGLAAVSVNPDDVWGIHAVVHVLEMQGRVDEGIRFLIDREADWGSGNLFTVHNWWHLALFFLEAGRIDDALAIYDAEVHNAQSDGVPLELVDASAMLWRLHLDGHDVGSRFVDLADVWSTRTQDDTELWYAFNDVHAVVALVGADRVAEAERHVHALAGLVHRNGAGSNVMMTQEVGLPAACAIIRFAQARYDEVIAQLAPIRRTFSHFGGSHAQRDLLGRTLLEAALRSDQLDLARALLAERLSLRDTSVYGWTLQARLEAMKGDEDASLDAEQLASSHRRRFASARPSAPSSPSTAGAQQ